MDFGKLLGKAGEAIKGAADKTGQVIAEKAEETNHHNKLMDFKIQILRFLTMPQLNNLANRYGVQPKPAPSFGNYDRPFEGTMWDDRTKSKPKKYIPTRDDFINALMDKITAADIIDWCQHNRIYGIDGLIEGRRAYMKRHNIDETGKKLPNIDKPEIISGPEPVQNILVPKQEAYSHSDMVKGVIERIETMTVPKKFPNEYGAHIFLWTKLCDWYPDRVKDEADRKMVDICIDEKVAIEVKNFINPSNDAEITRLSGQASRFARKYEAYIVVIFGGSDYDKQEVLRACGHLSNVFVVIK